MKKLIVVLILLSFALTATSRETSANRSIYYSIELENPGGRPGTGWELIILDVGTAPREEVGVSAASIKTGVVATINTMNGTAGLVLPVAEQTQYFAVLSILDGKTIEVGRLVIPANYVGKGLCGHLKVGYAGDALPCKWIGMTE